MKKLLARRELSLVVAIILIVGVAIALQPRFASEQNIRSILLWVPLLAVAAMGQTAVIITRGIDVSVGSILGLAGMTTAI
ncbi:MAG: ABC transporter permease, partial [Armatimonadaceae bacterium]